MTSVGDTVTPFVSSSVIVTLVAVTVSDPDVPLTLRSSSPSSTSSSVGFSENDPLALVWPALISMLRSATVA